MNIQHAFDKPLTPALDRLCEENRELARWLGYCPEELRCYGLGPKRGVVSAPHPHVVRLKEMSAEIDRLVLPLIGTGTNEQIAKRLNITVGMVKTSAKRLRAAGLIGHRSGGGSAHARCVETPDSPCDCP